IRASNLLLPLKQHFHVAGQCPVASQPRLQREQVGEVLPLVVSCATSIEPPVTNRWLEGRRDPGLKGIWWLHIIVPVQAHGWPPWLQGTVAHHHGPTCRREDRCLQPDPSQDLLDVAGDVIHASSMCTDTRAP